MIVGNPCDVHALPLFDSWLYIPLSPSCHMYTFWYRQSSRWLISNSWIKFSNILIENIYVKSGVIITSADVYWLYWQEKVLLTRLCTLHTHWWVEHHGLHPKVRCLVPPVQLLCSVQNMTRTLLASALNRHNTTKPLKHTQTRALFSILSHHMLPCLAWWFIDSPFSTRNVSL